MKEKNSSYTVSSLRRKIPNYMYVAFASWFSQVALAITQLSIIPVLTTELGIESYAAFTVMTSLFVWFSLADFSLGFSVQNYISEARAKQRAYSDYIFNACLLGVALLILIAVILLISASLLGDTLLSAFPSIEFARRTQIFLVTATFFTISGISNIAYRTWFAEHKGYFSNSLPALSSITGMLLIHVNLPSWEGDRLLFSLLVYSISPAFIASLVFVRKFYISAANGGNVNIAIMFKLIKRGASFWGMTLMASLVVQVDYLVMSQVLTAPEIVEYSITAKFFSLFIVCYGAMINALWPVFSEALVKKKVGFVKTLMKRYLLFSLFIVIVFTFVIVLMMPTLSSILIPNYSVTIPRSFIALTGVYYMIRVWTDMFAMVLNSLSELRVMWVYIPFQSVISISLQFLLSSHYGIYGIVLGVLISFLLTASWVLPWQVNKRFKLMLSEQ